jgi:hypothetical protein
VFDAASYRNVSSGLGGKSRVPHWMRREQPAAPFYITQSVTTHPSDSNPIISHVSPADQLQTGLAGTSDFIGTRGA